MIELSEVMDYVKDAPDGELQWLIKWTTDMLAERCRNAKSEIKRLEESVEVTA